MASPIEETRPSSLPQRNPKSILARNLILVDEDTCNMLVFQLGLDDSMDQALIGPIKTSILVSPTHSEIGTQPLVRPKELL